MEKKSEQLTLFAAGSPASHSVKPGSKEARMMTATSGRKCLGSFKNSNLTPVGLLQRMLLGSSIWSSHARFLTWKGKVTKLGHSYWVLAPSKPPIKDNDAGLLPTPDASNRGARKNQNGHQVTLQDVVAGHTPEAKKIKEMFLSKMWPTPTQDSAKQRTDNYKQGGTPLPKAVNMWPTPSANEDAAGKPGAKMQKMLGNHPEVREQGQGTLNAEWVTWLMGYPPNYLTLEEPGK